MSLGEEILKLIDARDKNVALMKSHAEVERKVNEALLAIWTLAKESKEVEDLIVQAAGGTGSEYMPTSLGEALQAADISNEDFRTAYGVVNGSLKDIGRGMAAAIHVDDKLREYIRIVS